MTTKHTAALSLLLFSSASLVGPATADEKSYQAFEQDVINARRMSEDRRYFEFLDEPSIQGGLYVLQIGADDTQPAHDDDEVYIITNGTATLIVEDERIPIEPGSVIFVRAFAKHHFVDILDELQAIVLFSGSKGGERDPLWSHTSLDQIRKNARRNENVWERFFDFKSLHLGLYMLPEMLNGDSALTHRVDEINIVTKGEALFRIDGGDIAVKPGSIIWVREGTPHLFHTLKGDFDVLIMFHQKPDTRTP